MYVLFIEQNIVLLLTSLDRLVLAEKKGALYTLFCAGGINPEDPWNPLDNQENGVMAFFRDVVAAFLNKKWVKVAVLIVFLGYLAVSSWAFSLVTEGLDRKRLTRFDSYSVGFYELEDQYFRDYPYRISVSCWNFLYCWADFDG